jgi:hypothetical protein
MNGRKDRKTKEWEEKEKKFEINKFWNPIPKLQVFKRAVRIESDNAQPPGKWYYKDWSFNITGSEINCHTNVTIAAMGSYRVWNRKLVTLYFEDRLTIQDEL